MDKMKLDTLIRRYTIHHEDESYIEMKDLKTMFEDLCKDEIALEKIEKSHKEKLEPIVIYGIETPKELEEKKNRINEITRDLENLEQKKQNFWINEDMIIKYILKSTKRSLEKISKRMKNKKK